MKAVKSLLILVLISLFMLHCSKDETFINNPEPNQELPDEDKDDTENTPSLNEVDPLSGTMGTLVTIKGENLLAVTEVYFNGVKSESIHFRGEHAIIAEVPFRAFSGPIKLEYDQQEVEGPEFNYVSSNRVTTLAGAGRSGDNDGVGSDARFRYPSGIVVDSEGNLMVTDGSRIRLVTSDGIVKTLTGSTPDYVDGSFSVAKFNVPAGMAQDNNGHIFISDKYNHKIRRIYPTETVVTWAGGAQGDSDGMAMAKFNEPSAVAVDNLNNIYVADTKNNSIRKVSATGFVTTIAGSAYGFKDGTGEEALFRWPTDVIVDNASNVYVADGGNSRIRKITPEGEVSTFAGGDYGYKDGATSEAQFAFPAGLLQDKVENIYIADAGDHRIRKISPDGMVSTIAGSDRGNQDGNGIEAQFNRPWNLALDEENHILYVTDYNNHQIRKILLD